MSAYRIAIAIELASSAADTGRGEGGAGGRAGERSATGPLSQRLAAHSIGSQWWPSMSACPTLFDDSSTCGAFLLHRRATGAFENSPGGQLGDS